MDGPPFKRGARRNRTATRQDSLLFQKFDPFGYVTTATSASINIAFPQKDK
jgi:hypothetical protein